MAEKSFMSWQKTLQSDKNLWWSVEVSVSNSKINKPKKWIYVSFLGGGSGGHWTDSLPRRDFYSNIAPTGSLPRRDKAGLGRPEPPRPPSAQPNLAGVASEAAAAAAMAASLRNSQQQQQLLQDNGLKGNNLRRRDLSLNRDNTSSFRDAFSTGNKGTRTPRCMYYVRSMYSHILLTMWYTATSATLMVDYWEV